MYFKNLKIKYFNKYNKNNMFNFYLGIFGFRFVFFLLFFFLLLCSIFFLYSFIINNYSFILNLGSWFTFSYLFSYWSFFFDDFFSLMFFIIILVSFFVFCFSLWYLFYDPRIILFIFYIFLFVSFMFLLISSNNIIQLFIGWEGVGLCSFLLINFWHTRKSANKSAMLAFFVNKIGDFFLFLFFCILFYVFKTFDISLIISLYNLNLNIFLYNFFFFINLFILIGSIVKSAQIGFHIWLPEAMEGPTPVSALIHAATMVTAGIYLINRFWFFFEFFPFFSIFISFIGTLTAFFGSLLCIIVSDVKKIVAYSTCGQLGYMFASIGFFNFSFSIFHLFTHALFKALLFLVCGYIIFSMSNEQDVRKYGGLFKVFPFHFLIFFLCCINLMGIPYFSGFFSKELILSSSFFLLYSYNYYFFFIFLSVISFFLIFSILFSLIYSFKLLLFIFFFSYRGNYKTLINFSFLNNRFYLFFFFMITLISGFFFFDFFYICI